MKHEVMLAPAVRGDAKFNEYCQDKSSVLCSITKKEDCSSLHSGYTDNKSHKYEEDCSGKFSTLRDFLDTLIKNTDGISNAATEDGLQIHWHEEASRGNFSLLPDDLKKKHYQKSKSEFSEGAKCLKHGENCDDMSSSVDEDEKKNFKPRCIQVLQI